MTSVRVVLGGLLVVAPTTAAHGAAGQLPPFEGTQAPAPPERFDPALTVEWLDTVERHAPGEPDDALNTAARWSGETLRRLRSNTHALTIIAREPNSRRKRFNLPVSVRGADREQLEDLAARMRTAGVPVTLKRAALLHTDVATLAPDVAATAAGPTRAGTFVKALVGDGDRAGTEGVSAHWSMARMLLDRLPPRPAAHDFVRDWYRATVALAQSTEFWDVLQLDHGLSIFPDDPVLQWLHGCQHEAYAAPLYQEFKRRFDGQGLRPDIDATGTELERAVEAFRHALAGDPTPVDARLRRGRVLALQGKRALAIRELEDALAQGPDRLQEYFARLILGTEQQAAGDLAAAAGHFEPAVALEPDSRVGRLALAQLARERGDREAITLHLRHVLAPVTDDDPVEPWWRYRVSHVAAKQGWLDAVRRSWNRETP